MDNLSIVFYIIAVVILARGLFGGIKKGSAQPGEELPLPPAGMGQDPQPETQEADLLRQEGKEYGEEDADRSPAVHAWREEDRPPAEAAEDDREDPPQGLAPFQEADDLKRAVVYSEILKRKYH